MDKKIKLKIVKVMKFTSKTKSSHVLLSINLIISFEDCILVLYLST